MLRVKLAVFTVAAGLLTATAAFAQQTTVRLDGDFGPVTLVIDRATGLVTGTYPKYNGKIFGEAAKTLNGGVTLTGTWVQPRSDQACATAVHGSRYWGKLVFSQGANAAQPKGTWSYCDAAPNRPWNVHSVP